MGTGSTAAAIDRVLYGKRLKPNLKKIAESASAIKYGSEHVSKNFFDKCFAKRPKQAVAAVAAPAAPAARVLDPLQPIEQQLNSQAQNNKHRQSNPDSGLQNALPLRLFDNASKAGQNRMWESSLNDNKGVNPNVYLTSNR